MNTLTQPLRDEHKELYPNVERIRQVAELTGSEDVRRGVEEVYDFLAYHLKPHAEAEEAALYPAVQRALGSPDATLTMARDHVEVGRYIEELAALRDGAQAEDLKRGPLRRVCPAQGPLCQGGGSLSPDPGWLSDA